jgi:DnaD/phage-associated family protein
MPADAAGAIPASLLVKLIDDVWDPLEVKVILAVAALDGARMPVREIDLVAQPDLRRGSRQDGSNRPTTERIVEALERAVTRGIVLRMMDEAEDFWLLLGTDENRARARTRLVAPGAEDAAHTWRGSLVLERPSIFTMYEQNIGLVTPIIADRLVEAYERYPESWIEDAISESVSYNRRSWRYIQRILENWATEGRNDETDRRDSARDLTREKHLWGKYAHLFRRDDLPDL